LLCQHLLRNQKAEPEVRRRRGAARELLRTPDGIEITLLDHVRGIDPPLQPGIETEFDHAPQAGAVMFEQGVQRLHIPAGEPLDVVLERIGRDFHDFRILPARGKSHLF
jgi:hypothetical protein